MKIKERDWIIFQLGAYTTILIIGLVKLLK